MGGDGAGRPAAEYIDAVLGSLKGQLDNTYIVDAKGNKTKLKKKGE